MHSKHETDCDSGLDLVCEDSGREKEKKDNASPSDCYSHGERVWMEWGQQCRGVLLDPLLRFLVVAKVSPDAITLIGAIFGIAFVPLALNGLAVWAITCLLLHVLLDGIDGPLARTSGTACSRGSFTDTFADQIVATIVTIGWMLMRNDELAILSGTIYIFVYTLVVAMSMVRNALSIPYAWLVRPRFFIYLTIAIDLLWATNWTLPALWVANSLLALKCLSGFFKLRNRLPGPGQVKSQT